jgi:diguanylate cyclase
LKVDRIHTVSDSSDWKQKYRDSLLEMEIEEKRWRQIEQVLRRLIGRLCAAGMGVNAQLDDELSALAAANRRSADAETLSRMADSLTTAVVALDVAAPILPAVPAAASAPAASPPQPAAGASSATRAALLQLLHQLPDAALRAGIGREALLSELASAATDPGLAAVVTRAADLIHEHGAALARERLEAAAVLSEVTQRLDEMARYLTDAGSVSQSRYDDAHSHNETVLWQVRELTGEVESATDLASLQNLVNLRLERVINEVCEFRAREENRLLEYNGRAEDMRARIQTLERETSDLHAKLNTEKHGARLDPLTGVANRKSFDERIAFEIARRSRSEIPVAMLLWDIDSFKLINDSYGHRAGDRVLQSVAGCFTAAARSSDFVARIGGEEFVILLNNVGLQDAIRIANEIRAAVEALRFHFRGSPVRVTVSCGVTVLNVRDDAEAAFDRADGALYRAKHSGKNVCIAA